MSAGTAPSAESPQARMEKAFVARKAIYRDDLTVFAYELMFRNSELDQPSFTSADQATAQVVLNTFVEIGLEKVVGSSVAFIHVTRSFLLSDYCLLLPKDRLVLQLADDTIPDPPMLEAISRLWKEGYLFALDNVKYAEWLRPLLALVDVVKVDIQALAREAVGKQIELLRPFEVRLLAKNVESHDDFEYCRKLGFEFYEGPFISQPQVVHGDKMPANRMAALRLLAKLQDPNLTTDQLEETVSQDVALSYKLVRYVNSAIHALPNDVASIRHAIVLVGTRRISNWAGLILYGQMDDKPTELMITAIVRARMCQQLALATKQTNAEQFFTVGLFSVLDALLDRPMPEALEKLPLAVELKAALIEHQGMMGSALLCVMAYEKGDWENAESAGIPGETIFEAYVNALDWTRQTMKELGLDADLKPQESIRRRSEAKLSLQKFADTQEQKIKEAEEYARKQVTRDLLARFDVEFQKLSLELEEKQRLAVAAAEKAFRLRADHALLESETAREQLKSEFDSATKQWDIERQHLLDGKRSANEVVQSKMQEIDELEKKLGEVTLEESGWEEQIAGLKSEMEQIRAAAEKQRLEAIADAEAAAEIRLAQVRTHVKQESEQREQQPARTDADAGAIEAEISRIVAEINELSEKIESPTTDLSAQIRYNRERAELESYVKGLRFSPNPSA